jgi:hypothetical protein
MAVQHFAVLFSPAIFPSGYPTAFLKVLKSGAVVKPHLSAMTYINTIRIRQQFPGLLEPEVNQYWMMLTPN